MVVKKCCYGECKSDNRYYFKRPESMNGVKFIPFPKPKTQQEKCLRWIKLCGRPQSFVDKIKEWTYICSKHFVGPDGPSDLYPDPIPVSQASSSSSSLVTKTLKPKGGTLANNSNHKSLSSKTMVKPPKKLVKPPKILIKTDTEKIGCKTIDKCDDVMEMSNDRHLSNCFGASVQLEMMTDSCSSKGDECTHRSRNMTPEDHMKRTRVLEAIAVLEKNKIPASSDNIMLQMGDGGICRKELLDVISELYTSGYINKNRGSVKGTHSECTKGKETGPGDSADSHNAGISITHDGLPKISSIHSYHSGKSFPVGGKDEKVIYHPPHHHHHHHHHPRFFHPPPHVMYHPGASSTANAHPSTFTHAHQVVPIHVPYEHVVEDSTHAPLAYYPFLSGEGKQMQWMFYPMNIPVNAVRPMVSEKNSSCHQKENVTPGGKENESLSPSPHTCPNKMKYSDSASLGEGKMIKEHGRHSPIVINDDYSSPPIVIPLEKKSFMQHLDAPNTHSQRDGGSKTSSSSSSSSEHNSSTERRFSVQSKEAVLAKKRKQLLGIVDRVTEVAARKSNVENIVRISTSNEVPPPPQSSATTPVNLPSVIPLVNTSPKKYGNELMDSYIDEIAMEAAKLRDKQKRERDKPYPHELCGVTPPSAGIPLKTASFMSKIRNRLDDILKNSEEEKEEILKEYSSSDTVRNILSSPPEFISRHRGEERMGERADEKQTVDKTVDNDNIDEHKNNHSDNSDTNHEMEDEMYVKSTSENEKYVSAENVVMIKGNDDKNELKSNENEKEEKHKSELDDTQLDKLLFDPLDFEKLKKARESKPVINPMEESESVGFEKHDDGDIHNKSAIAPRDFESIEHLLMQEPTSAEEREILGEEQEMARLNDEKHSEEERAELKQYFTRKKLTIKDDELRLKRNVMNADSADILRKRMRDDKALPF